MTVIGEPRVVGPWDLGSRYVLGWLDEKELIGAVHVSGLGAALAESNAAKSGRRASVPDIQMAGLDAESKRWLQEWSWGAAQGEQRELLIHDSSTKQWFYVRGAFIKRFGSGNGYTIAVNHVDAGEEPDWPD
ncbi:hypothetical protein K8640_39630 [Myxococcus sp. XM-1-1-1]|uniref:hypothetical protein n=1 Tax=unclassified Myxococcus TaxID=2648731 RepID=UPI00114152E3|nr:MULTISPECIES: hypothetical protein [unclassified Myxococcus]MBZ4414346.1 hypothetical protein [Myxococcus sp. XM-1-1-1]